MELKKDFESSKIIGNKYINTLNNKINIRTSSSMKEKLSPKFSSNILTKKRGFSSHSVHINKKKKFIIISHLWIL